MVQLITTLVNGTGPIPSKIVLVGEAPGQTEVIKGVPFVGESGQELHRMMEDAGLDFSDCYRTNVLRERPDGNKIEGFCVHKREAQEILPGYSFPALGQGKYLHPRFLPELLRLQEEIMECQPNLIIAFGATAAWALIDNSSISKVRGYVTPSTLVPGVKVLPTFHPAAVLRAWNLRVIVVTDLIKAKREAEFPEIRRPHREIWTAPTIADLHHFQELYLQDKTKILSVDTETKRGQIDCVGFSPSIDKAIVVPFWDLSKDNGSYWDDPADEVRAMRWCVDLLEGPHPLLFQNGLYDIQYFVRSWHCRPTKFEHDTMILSHALQPEIPKDLGFLGSVYTDEASWKLARHRVEKGGKRDE